jgi:hypothetical protein
MGRAVIAELYAYALPIASFKTVRDIDAAALP